MGTSTPPAGGPVARALLAWMSANGARLRALLEEEADRGEDLSPAGEAAIRAHLRLVAEALAAHAAGPRGARLRTLAERMPALLEERAGARAAGAEEARAALGFEVRLQLGEGGEDPSLGGMLDRRARVLAAAGFFLDVLDEALAPDPPVGPSARAWMRESQSLLSVLNARTGRRTLAAREAPEGRMGEIDPETAARVAQAAMLQAHVRFLVEALGAALGAAPPP